MYISYLDDIVAYYQAMQKSGNLPQRLIIPTPASIKDECMAVFESRYRETDGRNLSAFFRVENDKAKIHRAIKQIEISRFRPLQKFLQQNTKTDDLNIELLAWLIDFPDRPYNPEKYTSPVAAVSDGKHETVEESVITDDQKEQKKVESSSQKNRLLVIQDLLLVQHRRLSLVALTVLLVLASVYIIKTVGTSGRINSDSSGLIPGTGSKADLVIPAVARSTDSGLVYARCVGSSPCKACSNCSSCNWCNSGGTCGICGSRKPETSRTTQKRALQCQAITKKGKQCSRTAKSGQKYCWQHLKA